MASPWDFPPLFLKRKAETDPTIAYRIFPAEGEAKVAVLMSTGYFEHMGRYREVIERWNQRGILVAIYDLRGHGLSQGLRGYISRFDDYVEDALDLLSELAGREPWKSLLPPVLFGHSLGGLITIHVALRAPERMSGLALSSPYLERAKHAPAIKIAAGHLLSRVLPRLSIPADLQGSECTRSADIAAAADRDPLNFRNANVRWFTETSAAQKRALAQAGRLKTAIFCLQGGADLVARAEATDRFMHDVRSQDRHYQRLPGVYHEILNEPERATWIERFASAILAWKPAKTTER